MATKKVGSAGRLQARYGRKIRKKVMQVESSQKAKHTCQACLKNTLKRVNSGIWKCNKCGIKFAGGAYTPRTASGVILKTVERAGA